MADPAPDEQPAMSPARSPTTKTNRDMGRASCNEILTGERWGRGRGSGRIRQATVERLASPGLNPKCPRTRPGPYPLAARVGSADQGHRPTALSGRRRDIRGLLAQAILVQRDEPLLGGAEQRRVLAAPAVWVGMDQRDGGDEGAPPVARCSMIFGFASHTVMPAKCSTSRLNAPVVVHRVVDPERRPCGPARSLPRRGRGRCARGRCPCPCRRTLPSARGTSRSIHGCRPWCPRGRSPHPGSYSRSHSGRRREKIRPAFRRGGALLDRLVASTAIAHSGCRRSRDWRAASRASWSRSRSEGIRLAPSAAARGRRRLHRKPT